MPFTLLPVALVQLEPDLGTALILLFIAGTIILFAGVRIRLKQVTAIVALLVVLAPVMWYGVLQSYQKKRISTLLVGGDEDPRGAAYHSRQARIAVGSGKLLGKGYLQGTQNRMRFLPEQHTDFIYAVLAEEMGFILSAPLLLFYFMLIFTGLKIAEVARERFGALLAVGLCGLIFFHVFTNIGMTLGLLPVVGVTLPLFSYGGTSLVIFLAGVGLVINVYVRRFMF